MRRLPLTLLAFALAAPAQSTAPHTYRVAGTVVSAIDNHPLQRASIQLLNPEDQAPVQTTTSDQYGRFAFTGVPAGNHELQGTAPNYLATMYDEHEGFNTGIITGAAVDTESLVLKLHPESVIAGIVVDESAEPVQSASIQLFRQTHNFGDGRVVLAGSIATDDLGRFELPRLIPGTYFLAIIAAPWYAVHPTPAPIETAAPAGSRRAFPQGLDPSFADSIDPALDVAYPISFYPGTTDPARAAPILVHGGNSVDLHFQLSPSPAATLSLPRSPKGQPQAYPTLGIPFRGQMLVPVDELRQGSGQVVISGLAPGDYMLSQSNRPINRSNPGTAIHLGDRTTTESNLPTASDNAQLHVRLQSAHGDVLPSHVRVLLMQGRGDAIAGQVSDEKNEVNLEASPGEYFFEVADQQRPYAVRQIIAANGHPFASNNLHLAAGDKLSVILTVIPGIHTLKGVARKDGKPVPGAFILLFPSNEASDIRTSFRQQSDLDGSFDIRGLPPGAYTLLAIENGWDLDWQHQGALSSYLRTALTVHIPDTADKVQYLPIPIAVQSR